MIMMNPAFEEQENANKEKYIRESALSGKRYAEAEARYADLLNRNARTFAVNQHAGRKKADAHFRIAEGTEVIAESMGRITEGSEGSSDLKESVAATGTLEWDDAFEMRAAEETAELTDFKTSLKRDAVVRRYYPSKKEKRETGEIVQAAALEEKKENSSEREASRSGADEQKMILIDQILDEAYESEVIEQPLEEKTWFFKIGTALLAVFVLGVGVFALSMFWPEQAKAALEFVGIDWI